MKAKYSNRLTKQRHDIDSIVVLSIRLTVAWTAMPIASENDI